MLVAIQNQNEAVVFDPFTEKKTVIPFPEKSFIEKMAASVTTSQAYAILYPYPLNDQIIPQPEILILDFLRGQYLPFTRIANSSNPFGTFRVLNDGETFSATSLGVSQDAYLHLWDIKKLRKVKSFKTDWEMNQRMGFYALHNDYYLEMDDNENGRIFHPLLNTELPFRWPGLDFAKFQNILVDRELIVLLDQKTETTAHNYQVMKGEWQFYDFDGNLVETIPAGYRDGQNPFQYSFEARLQRNGEYFALFYDSMEVRRLDVYELNGFKKVFQESFKQLVFPSIRSANFPKEDKNEIIQNTAGTDGFDQFLDIDLPSLPFFDFSSDGRYFTVCYTSQAGRRWTSIYAINDNEFEYYKQFELVNQTGSLASFTLNMDQGLFAKRIEKVVNGVRKRVMAVWDVASEEIIHQFDISGNIYDFQGVLFHPTLPYLLVAYNDGHIEQYNVSAREKTVSIYPILDYYGTELLYTRDNKYYYSDKKNLHYDVGYSVQGKAYHFNQFDVKFNRPDLILKNIPGADQALIRAYENAYKTRLSKLGISIADLQGDFHVPEIQINDPDLISTTEAPRVFFNISATDTRVPIQSIHLAVNGVPVFGTRGLDFSKANRLVVSMRLEIPLIPGSNLIQIWARNIDGAESLRQSIIINNQPLQEKPGLHFVGIGVSDFDNDTLNLDYPIKDIQDLAGMFQLQQEYFDVKAPIMLKDRQVTEENLRKVKELLLKSKTGDLVIVFVASHGLFDENMDYFLASSQTDLGNVGETAIPYQAIENLLDSIPAYSKLLLLDACHSGEIDKENIRRIKISQTSKGKVKFRAVEHEYDYANLGLDNSFDMMKELFADLRESTGANIISSASGVEFAYEGEEWNNSVFAYALMNGLLHMEADLDKNNVINVSELQGFLAEEIPRLTENNQKPTFRVENILHDSYLWVGTDGAIDIESVDSLSPSYISISDTSFAELNHFIENDLDAGELTVEDLTTSSQLPSEQAFLPTVEGFIDQKALIFAEAAAIQTLYLDANNHLARLYLVVVYLLQNEADQARLIWLKFRDKSLQNGERFHHALVGKLSEMKEAGRGNGCLKRFLKDIEMYQL